MRDVAFVGDGTRAVKIPGGNGHDGRPASPAGHLHGRGVCASGLFHRHLAGNGVFLRKLLYEETEGPVGYQEPVGKPDLGSPAYGRERPAFRNPGYVHGDGALERHREILLADRRYDARSAKSRFFLHGEGDHQVAARRRGFPESLYYHEKSHPVVEGLGDDGVLRFVERSVERHHVSRPHQFGDLLAPETQVYHAVLDFRNVLRPARRLGHVGRNRGDHSL